MVSSTVYGIEEMLEQIYSLLNGYGYEVWMSYKGTVQIFPNRTAFEDCLLAVEHCDLFLGIITPHYGSGVVKGGLSITHQEMLKAIELKKPRWFITHAYIPFARALISKLGFETTEQREKMLRKLGIDSPKKLSYFKRRKERVIDDLRVLDMYDAATRRDLKVYQDRKGNWVQEFVREADAKLFVTAQFFRYKEVAAFLDDQFSKPRVVRGLLTKERKS